MKRTCDLCGRPGAVAFRFPPLPGIKVAGLTIYACHQGEAETLFDMPRAERDALIRKMRQRANSARYSGSLLALAEG